MIESQIKANAADLTSFDDWRFTMQPFSLQGGIQRARQIFGGNAELQAMLASLNRAVFGEDAGPPDEAMTRPPLH
jgi:type I restriction enzyme R subunit